METVNEQLTLILFYLMIGFACWAAHAMTCPNCRNNLDHVQDLLLDVTQFTLGWPLKVVGHILEMFRPRTSEEKFSNFIEEKMRNLGANGLLLDLTRHDGETEETFRARIQKALETGLELYLDAAGNALAPISIAESSGDVGDVIDIKIGNTKKDGE